MTDQLERLLRTGFLLFLIATLVTVACINADPFSLATFISGGTVFILAIALIYLTYRLER